MVDIAALSVANISSDGAWVKQAFFTPGNAFYNPGDKDADVGKWQAMRANIRTGRRFSTAEIKFTDTTPGGNFCINPRPQFTRWADIKMPGLAMGSKGMGEYYSEAIDDNVQKIHLQFGVPEFNSLTNFFARFFDVELAHMVNTGESTGFMFNVGKAAGYLLTLPIQLIVGVVNRVQKIVNFLKGNPASKFYYVKHTMPLYWSTVSVLVNKVAVNMGVIYGQVPDNLNGVETDTVSGDKLNKYGSGGDVKLMNSLLPDMMGEGGGIDMYILCSRAQRLAMSHYEAVSTLGLGMSQEEYAEAVKVHLNKRMDILYPKHTNLPGYLNDFYGSLETAKPRAGSQIPPVIENTDPKAMAREQYEKRVEVANVAENKDWKKNFKEMFQDGSAFATFAVDYEGASGESFSNSTTQSEVANKINSMSSTSKNLKFSFADGNLSGDPLTATIKAAVDGAMEFVRGGLNSVGLGGLSALAGSGYVNIPDIWDNSSANLTRSSYTIKLATPYGNKFSILTNIYIPLCMLLAAALPRSTGPSSYGPPFLCRLWSKGRSTIQIGMIDSLSIERGTGGIGWSVDNLPTAVDVSISIVSLEKNMNIPVCELPGPSSLFNLSMFDEDTTATDYLAALGGLGLYEQYYIGPKLSLNMANMWANLDSWASPAHLASRFVGSAPGRLISAFYRGTSRY